MSGARGYLALWSDFTIASIIVQWWGGKDLCVVVKIVIDDAFVVAAYLTDRVKKGTLLWPKKS